MRFSAAYARLDLIQLKPWRYRQESLFASKRMALKHPLQCDSVFALIVKNTRALLFYGQFVFVFVLIHLSYLKPFASLNNPVDYYEIRLLLYNVRDPRHICFLDRRRHVYWKPLLPSVCNPNDFYHIQLVLCSVRNTCHICFVDRRQHVSLKPPLASVRISIDFYDIQLVLCSVRHTRHIGVRLLNYR